MIIHIIKRDGRKVPFNVEKIANAIFKAAQAKGGTDFEAAMSVAVEVCKVYEEKFPGKTPTVEEIQDLVEKILIEKGHAKTAKAYILYRYERTRSREMKTNLMCVLNELTFSAAKDSDIKRENANIDGDTAMGTMLKYGSVSAKEYYEMYVLEPSHAKAHREGDIHIHDLDFYTLTTTCSQIDLKKLFTNGFSTGHGYLREPNDIASYSALACIAIQSNQNDQHGGQSIPTFDYAMADGVKKTYAARYIQNVARALSLIGGVENEFEVADSIKKELLEKYDLKPVLADDNGYKEKEAELLANYTDAETVERIQAFSTKNAVKETDRATYQAMEALIHNLNTMNSRAGAQTPFSSINYGTDTTPEGRMVIKNVLLAQEAGLGNGETPIFPIHIFKIKEGINYNPTDPNYDLFKLACRVSAKRLFPNFSFIDAPYNLKYYKEGDPDTEIAYMGCRTRVIGNVHDPSREIVTGRGNLSFTSINLPRLAITSDHNVGLFFEKLEEKMELVIDQLMHRFNIQCQKRVRNYPFLMGQGIWIHSEKLSPDDTVGEVLKHGTLSVGFIGLAEALKALIGAHHGESEEAQELGLRIVSFMKDKINGFSEKYQHNYSCFATPAEGLAGKFTKRDKKTFGILPGITDKDYYTNSSHVPVYYHCTPEHKAKIEGPYHQYEGAGHIFYVEIDGDATHNPEAIMRIVDLMDKYNIGYGSVNHNRNRCLDCGYENAQDGMEECPHCHGHHIDTLQRITGYLVGTTDRWNGGKLAELHDRVVHK